MVDDGMMKWGGGRLMNSEIEMLFECEYNSGRKRMEGLQLPFIKTEWRHRSE